MEEVYNFIRKEIIGKSKQVFPQSEKALYSFLIVQIMLPLYGQTTANYIFLDRLHLLNTPWFLLALGAGHGMYFLIMHSYFSNLSHMSLFN